MANKETAAAGTGVADRGEGAALERRSGLSNTLIPGALAVLFASACAGGGAGVVAPPPCTVNICGLIANTRGGPAITGASVVVVETLASTTTDAQGAFSFSGLSPSTYSLVATLSGLGASRLQGVTVDSVPVSVEMVMRPVLDPAKPVVAPLISLVNLSPGESVSLTKTFTINVAPGDALNPVKQILVRFGHRGDVPDASAEDTATMNVSWDTTANANGSTFVNIIAYDNNYDAAEWSVPVTVSNTFVAPPGGPPPAFATAVTFGQTVGTLSAQRQTLATSGRLRGDPLRLPLRDGRYLSIQSAPSGATLFAYAMWSPVFGATGYRVYKAFSSAGPYTLLADAMSGTGTDCAGITFSVYTLCHRDASPDLSVGLTVCYRIVPYSSGGEGTLSDPACTTPLARFNLNLTSPADETATIAPDSTPTFRWSPTAAVGTTHYYEGYVGGVTDDPSTWWFFCRFDVTSVVYRSDPPPGSPCYAAGFPLALAKRYEWDVAYALAYTAYTTGDAFSMAGSAAFGSFPLSSSGSLNGPFHFTTTQ